MNIFEQIHLSAENMKLPIADTPQLEQPSQKVTVEKIKEPATAYVLFYKSRFPQLKSANPTFKVPEISKIASKEWRGLSEIEKQVFRDQYVENKKIFNQKYPNYIRPKKQKKMKKVSNKFGNQNIFHNVKFMNQFCRNMSNPINPLENQDLCKGEEAVEKDESFTEINYQPFIHNIRPPNIQYPINMPWNNYRPYY